jgi:sugar lactone lactonase YvrE
LTNHAALWNYDKLFEAFAVPGPDVPDNRQNEGRVAPDVSFWVGSMQYNLNPDGSSQEMNNNCGALYRITPDGFV